MNVNLRHLFDNFSAAVLAVLVHLVLLGVLLVSLDWRPNTVEAASSAPMQAVLLDESQVTS